jgi:hypothetical protein
MTTTVKVIQVDHWTPPVVEVSDRSVRYYDSTFDGGQAAARSAGASVKFEKWEPLDRSCRVVASVEEFEAGWLSVRPNTKRRERT